MSLFLSLPNIHGQQPLQKLLLNGKSLYGFNIVTSASVWNLYRCPQLVLCRKKESDIHVRWTTKRQGIRNKRESKIISVFVDVAVFVTVVLHLTKTSAELVWLLKCYFCEAKFNSNHTLVTKWMFAAL